MKDKDKLIILIESAFKNVSLLNGIGIYEANAIDNHMSDKNRIKERSKDIRDNWKSIPDEIIDKFYFALSFMDADGLRFAIPAYMIFTVKYFDTCSSPSVDAIINKLSETVNWNFLSIRQKKAIANFLIFMVLKLDNNDANAFIASLAYENIWYKYDYG